MSKQFINISAVGVSSVVITCIAHMFVKNTVDMMESRLRQENAPSNLLEPIQEWKRKPFLKQIISFPGPTPKKD